MSIVSLSFIGFALATVLLYYIVPKRFRYLLLLAASIFFYISNSVKMGIYVLITAASVYAAALMMDRMGKKASAYLAENKASLTKEQKSAYKKKDKNARKAVMLCALLLNIGLLCVFKYSHFVIGIVNSVTACLGIPAINNSFRLLVPLGISFYTFQTTGYLVDVYWQNVQAEKNPFKMLLFTSFFPQMTQGPVSDFSVMSTRMFEGHAFSYDNFSRGFARFIWGYAKKVLLANMLINFVKGVFASYPSLAGITVLFGIFGYAIQIYADFSGYMDIMCGLCEMMGIELTENFDRPYFAVSVSDYWRRWHISIGTWFKKYVYYPAATAGWNRRLAKRFQSKAVRQNLSATLALLIVWLATGLWHGASTAYAVWGLFNGLFIILSLWLEPVYAKGLKALRIDAEGKAWHVFRILRTFILVAFIKVFPEVGTISQGFGLWTSVFRNLAHGGFISETLSLIGGKYELAIIAGMTLLMYVFSLMKSSVPIRERFAKLPLPVRCAVLAGIFVLVVAFGMSPHSQRGAFMYAQF